ncbi:MAG: polyphenol oxidase family protein [Tissierellia bacterium]|nr:polyphenol oxidase family protein [Tissierellia bacterium]
MAPNSPPQIYHYFSQKPLDFLASVQGAKTEPMLREVLREFPQAPKRIFSLYQKHSNHIFTVDENTPGTDFYGTTRLEYGDGLITRERGILLITKEADCVPLLLFDPVRGVQANLHSGWRGTLKTISKVAIETMARDYGTRPQDLICWIGPCICEDHFEVREDVVALWRETFDFADEVIRPKDPEHWLIHLKETNRRILTGCGVPEKNITTDPRCTVEEKNLHSYRRDLPNYGVNGLFSLMI